MHLDPNRPTGAGEQPNPYYLPEEKPAWRRALDTVEAWLGAFCGTLLSFGLVLFVILGTGVLDKRGVGAGLYCLVILALVSVLQGSFLLRVWASALGGDHPIGPAVARHTWDRIAILRPLRVLWWLAHILGSMLMVVAGEVQLLKQVNQAGFLFLTGLMFGMSVCCNVYIALLIKAVWNTNSAVETFWKWRLTVDTLLTGIAVLIAFN